MRTTRCVAARSSNKNKPEIMQIRQTLILALLLIGSIAPLAAQKRYTLMECIETALENNRNIKQQELNRQQRELAYSQARADLLPNLNANAGQNFVFGRSIGIDNVYDNINSKQTNCGISTDVTIFYALRMTYNMDALKADMYASEADLEKMQDDIIMSVSTAFLQALLNKELLRISENQLESTDADHQRRLSLVESGRLAEGELFEVEAQLAREELNRVQAENNLKLALLDLAQIMELETFYNFDIVAPSAETLINETALLPSEVVYE